MATLRQSACSTSTGAVSSKLVPTPIVSVVHHRCIDAHRSGQAVARTFSTPIPCKRSVQTHATPSSPGGGISLFPAGSKQASVVLPALMLQVDATELLASSGMADAISKAIGSGATAVVLTEARGAGGSALYEAAVKLKELLRGRAALLVVDRMDIAQAADADGVLLTSQGVPTVVAKRMLAASGGGLVGRIVTSAADAISAAADGANLVLVTAEDGGPPAAEDLSAAQSQQRSGNAIPVLMTMTSAAATTPERLAEAWHGQQQMDGIALDLLLLPAAASVASGGKGAVEPAQAAAQVIAALKQGPSQKQKQQAATKAKVASPVPVKAPAAPGKSREVGGSGWARRLQGADSGDLLMVEKATLARVMAFLEDVVPDLQELSLLRDAVRQLDEPFLVVVVGEFNSGKSSVINALLGKKFLAEGILPTTNEISILKFSSEPEAEKKVERQADGLFVRYLPSRLLEEMNIVDTPGTNVILERQQRLTEEYVPRADLVVFVMSADRPFSESEVRFLEYIRQWRKKVVFVVNKADMLETQEDVEEVKSFVADNARRVLKLDDPPVIAVSSRAAMRAKAAAALPSEGSPVVSYDTEALESNSEWNASGFGTFESLVYAFLVGGSGAAAAIAEAGAGSSSAGGVGEGVRLKLQTPLFVADALVNAAGTRLGAELATAKDELAAVRAVSKQLAAFRKEMDKDAAAQRDALLKVLASATGRMDSFIDRTIALSNVAALTPYLTSSSSSSSSSSSAAAAGSSEGSSTRDEVASTPAAPPAPAGPRNPAYVAAFESEALGGAFDRISEALSEHTAWLGANCNAQLNYYRSFVERRVSEAEAAGRPLPQTVLDAVASLPTSVGSPAVGSVGGSLNSADIEGSTVGSGGMTEFDLKAAAMLLDSEVRDAVVGTAYAALGAPALGLVVASWIDNFAEDLLVLGLAGAAAYTSVINLPLRRAEIKGKVAKLATKFVMGVQERMRAQLDEQLEATIAAVEALVVPLEAAAADELARLEGLERQRGQLVREVADLTRRTANLE
mmetsp:Transcript_35342/g.89478  ORF Transcript_35342/g.89478 Transcript_35342/m.89478 type:complete len:1026 (-) Transcript_35342:222-3299(-)